MIEVIHPVTGQHIGFVATFTPGATCQACGHDLAKHEGWIAAENGKHIDCSRRFDPKSD